jgi:propanol-preferring alcohol dehydrogenase
MKAWQFEAVGSPLAQNEVPEPSPEGTEVIIDVKAAGLCHSDVGFLDGTLTPLLPFRPITLGHEIAGVISALGPDATRFAIGDKVVIPVAITNGPGTEKNGGFAPKVAVLEEMVIRLPDGVPYDQGAAATDAGMTSYHAVKVQGGVSAGTKVGIIGFGGLGSLGTQAAVSLGAEVYVAEINEQAHDYARQLGVTGVSTSIKDFADRGLEVIIDYAGFGTTTNDAVETVVRDGRVVVVGLGVATGTINLQRLTLEQVHVIGSQAGTMTDCAEVLDMVAAGKLQSRITHISFDEIGEGVERLERGEVIGRLVAKFD